MDSIGSSSLQDDFSSNIILRILPFREPSSRPPNRDLSAASLPHLAYE